MIVIVHGPKLVPASKYKRLHKELLAFFTREDRMVVTFNPENVRIFFPSHRLNPDSVEFQVFAGSASATVSRDVRNWQQGLMAIGVKYWPYHVVNGFIGTLDVNAQFGSVTPRLQRKIRKKKKSK